jgi:hypothetical protein
MRKEQDGHGIPVGKPLTEHKYGRPVRKLDSYNKMHSNGLGCVIVRQVAVI